MSNLIYKVSVIDIGNIPEYDALLGAVIIAKSEVEARDMIMNRGVEEGKRIYGDEGKEMWGNPELTKCEIIGITEHPVGILLTNFNAG